MQAYLNLTLDFMRYEQRKKSKGDSVDLNFHVKNSKRIVLQRFPLEQVGKAWPSQSCQSPKGEGVFSVRLERWSLNKQSSR